MSLQLEKTLVILKPDAMQRNLLGEIITRFEKKGLKIVGLKMIELEDILLDDHYAHHKDKPFFAGLKNYMKSSPVVVIALEGIEVVEAVRLLVGPTKSRIADAGSIRGDYSMSGQTNIIHSSDSSENAAAEIKRFFKAEELFNYKKIDFEFLYGDEEREELV
ncbi:nucleoside-diphosphate kinase [Candidatus Falkowbacteria bacterium]|uniref:Nucleoside diphosphate kinase n=1 Tax=Candidatus Buchananbacteria bacterium CG10_big_fil_rev_8_21_14_0_10_33_19 TaxID=1974525 RepID=A0A2H0W2V9_9BACT|nr:nucleoside-diphosphate kinase [Candidatus Falkowbacteria bacterium]PIS05715.1 MAG: nucleoside-diphosphate kinase [Candidatus Buchananbacteria bacterium CG10_big_fil_rev_8_21_14_0_10_33_19]